MGKVMELAGQRFGRLTARKIVGLDRGYKVWICDCDCGGITEARSSSLTTGNVRSCGCMTKKHGMTNHPTYKVWLQLRAKCLRPTSTMFKNYGAKGIRLCNKWLDFNKFYADVGDRPKNKVFDRKDVTRDYEPGNVHWVSSRNNRNDGHLKYYTHNGVTKSLSEWARKIGITRQGLWFRLNESNMTIKDAIEEGPARK